LGGDNIGIILVGIFIMGAGLEIVQMGYALRSCDI